MSLSFRLSCNSSLCHDKILRPSQLLELKSLHRIIHQLTIVSVPREIPARVILKAHAIQPFEPPPSTRETKLNKLPLKITARPPVVEARDLNGVEESGAECVGGFRVQPTQTIAELFVTIYMRGDTLRVI